MMYSVLFPLSAPSRQLIMLRSLKGLSGDLDRVSITVALINHTHKPGERAGGPWRLIGLGEGSQILAGVSQLSEENQKRFRRNRPKFQRMSPDTDGGPGSESSFRSLHAPPPPADPG